MILVTGGCGYIGSHTVVCLLEAGYEVIIIDNLVNSTEVVLTKIKKITGKEVVFYKEDVCNKQALRAIFTKHKIDAVLHFAGLKAVGESCAKPLLYYANNLNATMILLEVMQEMNCYQLIFSSSATVYGEPQQLPLSETHVIAPTNPYGSSKAMQEQILLDMGASNALWKIALLRYFNPIGAHQSGLIGEAPSGIPNNLMPYVTQVAVGKLAKLSIFGNDYQTLDGTGVRDYIHVMDLAQGHLAALDKLPKQSQATRAYNLGTGYGYSVLQVINFFTQETSIEIPYQVVDRRDGDVASCYCDAQRAKNELNWQAKYKMLDMIKDSWRWQSLNPDGYSCSKQNVHTRFKSINID